VSPASSTQESTQPLLAPEPGDGQTSPAPGPGLAPLADPLVGRTLCDRYRVLELVGRGGMGVVYKVEHAQIGKLLAMKVLAGPLGADATVLARFKREAMLASRLFHPNSVQVFDYGVCQGLIFLIMEFVHGRDLSRILEAESPLPAERAAKLLIQVCGSLAEAHAIGIVHRDLKPANIMLANTRDGQDFVKVLDFGLAKLRASQELNEVTGGGTLVGTPNYMSPEQIVGRPVDNRADVYALGAIMFRMLVGKAPFGGGNATSIFRRHVEEPVEPPHLRAPELGIPQAASAIVLRAMEKDPARRYQRIEDMQAALVDLAGGPAKAGIAVLLDVREMTALNAAVARAVQVETYELPRGRGTTLRSTPRSLATRDEIERFERRFARRRLLRAGLAVVLAALVAAGGFLAWRAAGGPAAFDGEEREPNDSIAQANDVPFGSRVAGVIGRRLAPDRSDEDHYRIVVPPGVDRVSIRLSDVPNMPLCLAVSAAGAGRPLVRWCPGRPEAPVEVPSFPLAPGGWDFAVEQDIAVSGGTILESISDHYYLTVGPPANARAD
jgi:serine/threonine-protein kinase